ncbi:MAG TPA: J domain-containing protein, partial [Polyangiaceae bacterium]|nr:J domain-containing protein [Polyangiaceae bacterium]
QQQRSLRDIFRNLARAVHPDRAGHDGERARRTEVMKEVTRAYEEGDLARLIEIESTWHGQQAPTEAGDSEARCRELERINRELLD